MATTSSIAFSITLAEDTPVVAPLEAIPAVSKSPVPARRLTPISGMKGSLSTETINDRLKEAAERKQNHLLKVAASAGHGFKHAQKIASARAAESESKLHEINEKLDAAARHRDELEQERLRKLAEHSELVKQRRSGPPSPTLSRVQTKLEAAEARRAEICEENAERLQAHLSHVRELKEKKAAAREMGGLVM
ncbi:hypothetical protein HDU89_002419 [Geranomyces variabilis]|nr:hypothetical protein HDU90_000119 [Geranomyces variabilis]KAJ3157009.1 hypothetical protein HDU89_002419 [Geranomyces variabilis]KAJ3166916.1 hypothetical protein HDU88_003005 [Geranomyces variabilis]